MLSCCQAGSSLNGCCLFRSMELQLALVHLCDSWSCSCSGNYHKLHEEPCWQPVMKMKQLAFRIYSSLQERLLASHDSLRRSSLCFLASSRLAAADQQEKKQNMRERSTHQSSLAFTRRSHLPDLCVSFSLSSFRPAQAEAGEAGFKAEVVMEGAA